MKNKGMQAALIIGLITIFSIFVWRIPDTLNIQGYIISLKLITVGIWITIIFAILSLLALGISFIKQNESDKKGTEKFEKVYAYLFKQTLIIVAWVLIGEISINLAAHISVWIKTV